MVQTVILMTFLVFVQNVFAWKGCKLNQYGQNICTEEYALYHYTSTGKNIAVTVVSHQDNFKTVVKMGSTERPVSINSLIGNKLCETSEDLCKDTEVFIKSNCNAVTREAVAVLDSFENDLVLIETSEDKRYLYKRSCLTQTK